MIVELSEIQRNILESLEMLLRKNLSIEQAADKLRGMGLDRAVVDEVIELRAQIAADLRDRSVRESTVSVDPEELGPAWYTGGGDLDIFWPGLKDSLLADPGWAAAVDGLDHASHDVVSLLGDPHAPTIRTRGLVVGHVQSGKTANFTATIAKAADAGYRLFIVLGGVHNSLRRQTQLRLERQLVDLEPARWVALTSEQADFGNPFRALPLMKAEELRMIAIVKKNASRLKRLRDWLQTAADEGGLTTCPVLIIDDEADQAGVNSARNADLNRTKINELLVDILKLPRVAYVGYTATPFANVLIDPKSPHDLYPRTFIYALAKPDTYFGAEELFGLGRSEDEGGTPRDVVRIVPEDEAQEHVFKKDVPFHPAVSPCLESAIRWFMLATAARRARSGSAKHSSMLIHTSARVAAQFAYKAPVQACIRSIRAEVDAGDLASLRELWVEEAVRETAESNGLAPVSFDEVAAHLADVLSDVSVVVDNGSSSERLLYDDEAATTVIAIGGNTLSRGLTLEGLVSSYFLRGANAYDTLLQMGRWFGYRPGYADLPRIWTTRDLIENFRHLALVEREIRSDIARYSREQTTPEQMAVRIRLHPDMQVTARLRMQFAVPDSLSFSGQRPQTIKFHHRDPARVEGNQKITRNLISAAIADGSSPEVRNDKVVFRDVAVGHVTDFLGAYDFVPEADLSGKMLLDYIDRQVGHKLLRQWNVAIITKADNTRGDLDVGVGARINLIERSKLTNYSSGTVADIGTLMSKPDRVADLMDAAETKGKDDQALLEARTASGRALLILYPIAARSQPRQVTKGSKERGPLDAVGDLVGLAVAFPSAPNHTDPASTVKVDLSRIPAAEITEDDSDDLEYTDDEGELNEVDLEGSGGV